MYVLVILVAAAGLNTFGLTNYGIGYAEQTLKFENVLDCMNYKNQFESPENYTYTVVCEKEETE